MRSLRRNKKRGILADALFYLGFYIVLFNYNIYEQTNTLINDGVKRCKKNYTFNFTSMSIGGFVQLPPVFSGDLVRVLFRSLS